MRYFAACIIVFSFATSAYADVVNTSTPESREARLNSMFMEASDIVLVRKPEKLDGTKHYNFHVEEVFKGAIKPGSDIEVDTPNWQKELGYAAGVLTFRNVVPEYPEIKLDKDKSYLLFLSQKGSGYILFPRSLFDGYLSGHAEDFDLLPYGGALADELARSQSLSLTRALAALHSTDEKARIPAIASLFRCAAIEGSIELPCWNIALAEFNTLIQLSAKSEVIYEALTAGNFMNVPLSRVFAEFKQLIATYGDQKKIKSWVEKEFMNQLTLSQTYPCNDRSINLALFVAGDLQSPLRHQALDLLWEKRSSCHMERELGKNGFPEFDARMFSFFADAVQQSNKVHPDLNTALAYFSQSEHPPTKLIPLLIAILDRTHDSDYGNFLETMILLERITGIPMPMVKGECALAVKEGHGMDCERTWDEALEWKKWWAGPESAAYKK